MFNFQVKEASIPNGQFFITVPLTAGEMVVLKSLANVRSCASHRCYDRPHTGASVSESSILSSAAEIDLRPRSRAHAWQSSGQPPSLYSVAAMLRVSNVWKAAEKCTYTIACIISVALCPQSCAATARGSWARPDVAVACHAVRTPQAAGLR